MTAKLALGSLGSIVGALAGAVAWAAITSATHFQIGYMAIGVGLLAGYGMRFLGGGRQRSGGIIAGAVAFLGCVLGNLLTAAIEIGQHGHYPVGVVLLALMSKPGFAAEILRDGFDLMDLLFYAIAVYAGYRTALTPPAAAPPAPA